MGRVESEHLLLALARGAETPAAHLLASRGLTSASLLALVRAERGRLAG